MWCPIISTAVLKVEDHGPLHPDTRSVDALMVACNGSRCPMWAVTSKGPSDEHGRCTMGNGSQTFRDPALGPADR